MLVIFSVLLCFIELRANQTSLLVPSGGNSCGANLVEMSMEPLRHRIIGPHLGSFSPDVEHGGTESRASL